MKQIIIVVIFSLFLGCKSITTVSHQDRNHFSRTGIEQFCINGTVLVEGWGIDQKSHQEISFLVPGEPYAAYLYWAGRNQTPLEDDFLYIDGKQIKGELIYGEIPGNPPLEIQYIFTMRYDVSSFVKKGVNDFKVWGFDAFHNSGLGLVVLYQDNREIKNRIVLKNGLGFFWAGLEKEENKNSSLIEFKIEPDLKDRDVRVFMMFAGGAPSPRDEKIWFLTSDKKVEDAIISKGEVLFENQIESKQGGEWDLIDFEVAVPEGAKYIYFQVESPQDTSSPDHGDSLNFVLSGVELTLQDK
ncbi:MAG: hypothetical protein P9M06_04190 [Candidatus Saelkia tenebricola]|nr:hypothetical protein [Candidatus Saelkia tenebricola]